MQTHKLYGTVCTHVELGAVLAFNIIAVISSTVLYIYAIIPYISIINSMLFLNHAISNCAMLLLLFLPP